MMGLTAAEVEAAARPALADLFCLPQDELVLTVEQLPDAGSTQGQGRLLDTWRVDYRFLVFEEEAVETQLRSEQLAANSTAFKDLHLQYLAGVVPPELTTLVQASYAVISFAILAAVLTTTTTDPGALGDMLGMQGASAATIGLAVAVPASMAMVTMAFVSFRRTGSSDEVTELPVKDERASQKSSNSARQFALLMNNPQLRAAVGGNPPSSPTGQGRGAVNSGWVVPAIEQDGLVVGGLPAPLDTPARARARARLSQGLEVVDVVDVPLNIPAPAVDRVPSKQTTLLPGRIGVFTREEEDDSLRQKLKKGLGLSAPEAVNQEPFSSPKGSRTKIMSMPMRPPTSSPKGQEMAVEEVDDDDIPLIVTPVKSSRTPAAMKPLPLKEAVTAASTGASSSTALPTSSTTLPPRSVPLRDVVAATSSGASSSSALPLRPNKIQEGFRELVPPTELRLEEFDDEDDDAMMSKSRALRPSRIIAVNMELPPNPPTSRHCNTALGHSLLADARTALASSAEETPSRLNTGSTAHGRDTTSFFGSYREDPPCPVVLSGGLPRREQQRVGQGAAAEALRHGSNAGPPPATASGLRQSSPWGMPQTPDVAQPGLRDVGRQPAGGLASRGGGPEGPGNPVGACIAEGAAPPGSVPD